MSIVHKRLSRQKPSAPEPGRKVSEPKAPPTPPAAAATPPSSPAPAAAPRPAPHIKEGFQGLLNQTMELRARLQAARAELQQLQTAQARLRSGNKPTVNGARGADGERDATAKAGAAEAFRQGRSLISQAKYPTAAETSPPP